MGFPVFESQTFLINVLVEMLLLLEEILFSHCFQYMW